MALSSRTILNIIELVYYGPAMLLALWIIKKHGMGRQSGWIYLAILALVRIIGASSGIAADSHPSQGLFETTTIAYSIGLSPLLLAWLGIIKRVNEGMHAHSFPPRFINVVNIPILVGLILGIVGGTKLFDSNPASVSTGVTYTKAAVMLLLVALIALSAISVFTIIQIRHVIDSEKRLVFTSLAVIPFVFVRIAYSIVVDFDRGSTIFSITSNRTAAVVVQAVMSVAMEFIVVLIFLVAGFVTSAIPRGMVRLGHDAAASAKQPQQHYGGLAGRDNSPMETYSRSGAAPTYAGYTEGQEHGVAGGYSSPSRV